MRKGISLIAIFILILIVIPISRIYDERVLTSGQGIILADDGAAPVITLVSPANESIVIPFSLIDIEVTDNVAVSHVLYRWNLMLENETFESPYDLMARTSEVGHYLYVYANDTSDTWTSAMFYFVSDGTSPEIELTTPTNNSLHQSGIDINVTVTDIHLTDVYYSWDDEEILHVWNYPYSTQLISGDGQHTLHVYADDAAGNWIETNFMFTVDDDAPDISLRDLVNGTARQSGSIIDIDVKDASTSTVLYKWDSESELSNWSEPFQTYLPAGETLHYLTVFANDSFSREQNVTFEFIGDDTIPVIYLDSLDNGSLYKSGTQVIITATDLHLLSIIYNWDRGVNQSMTGPVFLPSGDWEHILRVYVNDTAENMASATYTFLVDDSPPVILEVPYVHPNALVDWSPFDLTWIAFDDNPESYIVIINGTEIDSGVWEDIITVQVMPPPENVYTFWYNCTIILYDSVGNMVVNSTWVRVSIWYQDGFEVLGFYVLVGAISACVIIILVVLWKKGILPTRN